MFCVLYCWWKKQDLFTNNSEVPEESHLVLQAVWGEAKERNSHEASWGGWSHSHLIITWTYLWFGEGATSISWQWGWSSGLFCSGEDSPWKGDIAFTALLWVEMQQSTRRQSWEGCFASKFSTCTSCQVPLPPMPHFPPLKTENCPWGLGLFKEKSAIGEVLISVLVMLNADCLKNTAGKPTDPTAIFLLHF